MYDQVIVIDGAHLRGNYGGCVITASAQDGNFQIFPVAFGIVDSENDRAWEWFLTMLRQILPNDPTVTFVSDRHSSIYSSLRKVYDISGYIIIYGKIASDNHIYLANMAIIFCLCPRFSQMQHTRHA